MVDYTKDPIDRINLGNNATPSLWNDIYDQIESNFDKIANTVSDIDTAITNAEANANSYTDTEVNSALNTATSYTDTEVSSLETQSDDRYLHRSNNLTDLGDVATARQTLDVYTTGEVDTAVSNAESNANSYTDTQISNLDGDIDSNSWNTAYDRSVTGVSFSGSGNGNATVTVNRENETNVSASTDLSHSHDYGDLPMTSTQASNWDTAYDDSITNISGGGNSSITLTVRNGSNLTASTSHSHDYGDLPMTSTQASNWDTAYDRSPTGVSVSGSGNGSITVNISRQGTNISDSTSTSHSHDYGDLPISSTQVSGWDIAYDRIVTDVSGSGNGTLTITRNIASNITTDLSHNHSADDITSGTLSTARLPTITTSEVNFANQSLNTNSDVSFNSITVDGEDVGPIEEAIFELGNLFDSGEDGMVVQRGGHVIFTGIGSGFGILNHSSSATPSSDSGVIPSSMRPNLNTINTYYVGTNSVRRIEINPSGRIKLGYYDGDLSLSAESNSVVSPVCSWIRWYGLLPAS